MKRKYVFAVFIMVFISLVFSSLQIRSVLATPLLTKTLVSGENLIHGSFYYQDFLWFCTNTNPTRILKMNPNDLSYQTITLTTIQGFGKDLEGAEESVWTILSGGTYATSLIKLNPDTLAWSTAITFADFERGQSLTYAYNYLWIGGESQIAQVNLTDLSYTLYDYSSVVNTEDFHAITYGNGWIWATTSGDYVLKINSTSPTTYSNISLGCQIPDDIVYVNDKLYFGTEETPSRIYYVTNDMSANYTTIENSEKCYGTFAYSNYIWTVHKSTDNTIRKISYDLTVTEVINSPSDFLSPNEMVFLDNYFYVTYYTSPSKVIQFPYLELVIDSTPSNVQFSINGINKTTPFSDIVTEASYEVAFPSSFLNGETTWYFAYWNDNTTNINPNRTITLEANSSYSVTYITEYESSYPTGSLSWYMRSDTHTVNGVNAYQLNETNSETTASISKVRSGSHYVYWSFRVYAQHSSTSNSYVGTSSIYRLGEGEGLQNSTLNVDSQWLDMGFSAVKIEVYTQIGSDSEWQLMATFITNRLLKTGIVPSEWTFSIYTNRTYTSDTTYSYFKFGNTGYASAIYNVKLKEPTLFDWTMYKMRTGDLIGGLLNPYTYLIGSLFYAIPLLIICIPLYHNYHSFTPILFVFVILGGAGVGISRMIPEAGLQIGWVLIVLGLAGLLYKVLR